MLPCGCPKNLKDLSSLKGIYRIISKFLENVKFKCKNKCSEKLSHAQICEGVHEYIECSKIDRKCLSCHKKVSNDTIETHYLACKSP